MTDILEHAPWTDEEINTEALKFLAAHPSYNRIPIEIERIIEIDLQIDIIPLPGLRHLFEGVVDALISQSFKEIRVDMFIWENRENRYRFTLAHEIGHMVLHTEVYKLLDMSSLEAAKRTILNLPPSVLATIEDQAQEFAGRVLVPRKELKYTFHKERPNAEKRVLEEIPGLDTFDQVNFRTAVQDVLIYALAGIFRVSTAAMRIRLKKEGLIPRND